MKEATGELSMTAIVVVILGVLAVVAPIVVRTVGNTLKMRTACQAAFGCGSCTSGKMNCSYVDDAGNTKNVSCSCTNTNNNSNANVNVGG